MSPINNRTGFRAQTDTIKAYPPFYFGSTESSHVSAATSIPSGSSVFVISHKEANGNLFLLVRGQILTHQWNEIVTSRPSNDMTFPSVHEQESPGNVSPSLCCWYKSHSQVKLHANSAAAIHAAQHPADADTACTAAHIHQSHWFHIDDDRFIIIPPRMIHSLRRILLPTRAFVFNSRQKYLRLALTLWRRHDHFLPFQKPPAWPAKSRHSRATLELSQLSEQLSLLAPPRPSCVRRLEDTKREPRVQNWADSSLEKLKDRDTYKVS